VTSIDSDGFSLGSWANNNTNADTHVSWLWKAGGSSGVSNTDGTITSSVSVNNSAGFSIVKYTGNNTNNATYGHGLSQAPEMVLTKVLTEATYYWQVYHTGLTSFDYALFLNETNPENNNTNRYKAISASTIQVGTDGGVNAAEDYIAYCFHSVDGYSKVGSYEGNGSGDGTFIYTGFAPAIIIIKNIDDTQDWSIWDNKRVEYNVINKYLKPNLNSATSTATSMDMVSNGFRCRGISDINNSNKTMVYIAFAESPFKTSNAR